MLFTERAEYILNQLSKYSFVKIPDLAAALDVSLDTVRRDLKKLEESGLLSCVRGGAGLPEMPLQFSPFIGREIINIEEKRNLVQKAVSLIRDGDVISMNAGTTNSVLAEELIHLNKKITVITNNISALTILMNAPQIKVIVPGGFLDPAEKSLYGYPCETEFANYFTDLCFLSINAVNPTEGYSDFRYNDMNVMRIMAEHAKKRVALMDSHKFMTVSKRKIFALAEIDLLVTDDGLDKNVRKKFIKNGTTFL